MPRDLKVGLTVEQIANRRDSLGGSDANILMSGDDVAILHLWRVKRGEEASEDLSGVLPVVLGSFTEPLNLYWYERTTGRDVTNEGESRKHAEYSFMACTLDGMTTTEAGEPAVFEAKHVNAFAKPEEVVQKYMPQLHHNMMVCGVERSILSVFVGTMKYEFWEVNRDDWYLASLMDREREFWRCVQSGESPVAMPQIVAPTPVAKFRTVDMGLNNEWASHAVDWLANKDPASKFEKATKGLKVLMEADVGEAFGHGIVCKRSKDNKLSIKETKNG